MNLLKLIRCLLPAATLIAAFIYWPVACAPQRAPGHGAAAPAAPLRGSELVASSLLEALPHPAFAMASPTPGSLSVADVAEKAVASVVSVSSKRTIKAQSRSPFFRSPPGQRREQEGLGSGVLVSRDGIVLTNNHVVEGATEIKVTTSGGREFLAELIGADSKSDLAVLRLKGDTKGLRPLAMGDSESLRLGDVVLAIGNPFGVGQTVTMGIVSAKGRADVGIVDYEDFIQTDAAINPGNSGGALVNMRGELVGINTAILSRSGGYQGIGFAIPSNMAKPIWESLLKNGKVVRGFLGINIQDVTPELASALGLAASEGVLVAGVSSGSAAEKSGVKRGDVIIAVDGTKTNTAGRLRNVIAAAGGDKKVKLSLLRDGKKLILGVKLGVLQDSGKVARAMPPGPGKSALGMKLRELTPELRQRFSLESSGAKIVVVAVEPRSTAARAGLRPGDALLEVNRKAAASPSQVRKHLAKSSGAVLLVIQRGSATQYLVVKR